MLRPLQVVALAAVLLLFLPVACKKKSPKTFSEPDNEADSSPASYSRPDPAAQESKPHYSSRAVFPRRLLAIGISNYALANPIRYGRVDAVRENERRDVTGVFSRLAAQWKIPSDQTYFLADLPRMGDSHPERHTPTRPVVEGAIERFLETSRKQDRLVIVFAGHAIEKGGEAYLVPLDGDLDDVTTLIPLKEVYAKIDRCPAQQKLVIFDVCRFDPGHKAERPAFGEMTKALEKELHRCPRGTTVWTSCSASQHSYEYAHAQVDTRQYPKFEIFGSVFLNVFIPLEVPWIRDKWLSQAEASRPDDELPISMASDLVNAGTSEVVKIREKKKSQTPKITTSSVKTHVAYDPREKPARPFEFPTPRAVVKDSVASAIFKEIGLPPLKAVQTDGKIERGPDNFPFPTEVMKEYGDDGPTFEEIRTTRAKYVAKFPLRVAAVDALDEMRKQGVENAKEKWPAHESSPINDAEKKKVAKYQRTATTHREKLEDLKNKLEDAQNKKGAEKSRRWLAHFDYAYAEVRIRLVLVYEYNLALSKVKGDALPELDAKLKQNSWRLESNEKLMSSKEIRDISEEGKTALAELIKQYPDTPWAVLAKSHVKADLGLRWAPAASGGK